MPQNEMAEAFFQEAMEAGMRSANDLSTSRRILSWAKSQVRGARFTYAGSSMGTFQARQLGITALQGVKAGISKLVGMIPLVGSALSAVAEKGADVGIGKAQEAYDKRRMEELSSKLQTSKITIENYNKLQAHASELMRREVKKIPEVAQKSVDALDKMFIVRRDLETQMNKLSGMSEPNCHEFYKVMEKWCYLRYRVDRAEMYLMVMKNFCETMQSRIDSFHAEKIVFEMDLVEYADKYFETTDAEYHNKTCKKHKDDCYYWSHGLTR